MPRLIIFTNEPENFVPKELKSKAEAAGWQVELLNPDVCFLNVSDKPALYHDGKLFDGAEACIPRLSESNLDYKTAIMEFLAKTNVRMLNSAESMAIASNKLQSQTMLNAAGIKTPNSAMLMNPDQLEAAHNSIGGKFPVILKTLSGTHGVGVMRVDSAGSMMSVAQMLAKENVQYMLQEYIEHEESRRILMLNGEVIACVSRSVPKDDFRTNAHQGAELTLVEATPPEIEAAKRVCDIIGTKLGAVDYLVHEDGSIVVFELNGSPGWEAMQKVVPDVDIAQRVIDAHEITGDDANAPPEVAIEPEVLPEPEILSVAEPVVATAEQTEESVEVDEAGKELTAGKVKDFNLAEGDEISYENFSYTVKKVAASGDISCLRIVSSGPGNPEEAEITLKPSDDIIFISRPGMATGFTPNAVAEAEAKSGGDDKVSGEKEIEYETKPEDKEDGKEPVDLTPVNSATVKIADADVETPIVGSVQKFVIKRFNDDKPLTARVDTGATTSSINGENVKLDGNLISFTFNGTRYRCHVAKVVTIKSANGDEERPIVKFDIEIEGIALSNVEFNISERGDMKYEALLGRSALSAAGVLVNPALGELEKNDGAIKESLIDDVIDLAKHFAKPFQELLHASDVIQTVVDSATPITPEEKKSEEKVEQPVKEEKVFDKFSILREAQYFEYKPGMTVEWSNSSGATYTGIVESVEKDIVNISVSGIPLEKSLIDKVIM